jgi:hypothetical protein
VPTGGAGQRVGYGDDTLDDHRGEPLPDGGRDHIAGLRSVDDEVAARVTLGEPEERLPHPLVELRRLGLQPVGRPHRPAQARFGWQIEHHGEVGHQAPGGPPGQLRDLLRREAAPGALVGEGGVDEAVGDDHGPARESRPDDRGDVLRPVGGVQQRFGPRGQPPTRRIEQRGTQLAAHRGPARLPGQHHLVTAVAHPGREQPRLRRLACPLAPFEGDEYAGPGGPGGQPATPHSRRHIAPQRHAPAVVHVAVAHHANARGEQPREEHGDGRPVVGRAHVVGEAQLMPPD